MNEQEERYGRTEFNNKVYNLELKKTRVKPRIKPLRTLRNPFVVFKILVYLQLFLLLFVTILNR